MSNSLRIVGAVYGLMDVTTTVASHVVVDFTNGDKILNIPVTNATFGDSWVGITKSLTVVYQYGGGLIQTMVVVEGAVLNISPPRPAAISQVAHNQAPHLPGLKIIGAAYGLADVTATVAGHVAIDPTNGSRIHSLPVNNSTFGDSWFGVQKSVTVIYQFDGQEPKTVVAVEGSVLNIHYCPSPACNPDLVIVGATYGTADVTAKAKALVTDNSFVVTANNDTFGDSWYGTLKSLVVVYLRSGVFHTCVVEEHQQMVIGPPLRIIGATYGPKDVTGVVVSRIGSHSGIRDLPANNDTFGDSWYGVGKSLTVVYQYEGQQPQTAVVGEGSLLNITFVPQIAIAHEVHHPTLTILGAAYGLADVTAAVVGHMVFDQTNGNVIPALPVGSNTFGDSWYGIKKSLIVVYQYSGHNPQTIMSEEGATLSISHSFPLSGTTPLSPFHSDPNVLTIVGASYGTADVTTKVASLVNNNSFRATASNDTFGDTWYGIAKSLAVVYLWHGAFHTCVVQEGQEMVFGAQ